MRGGGSLWWRELPELISGGSLILGGGPLGGMGPRDDDDDDRGVRENMEEGGVWRMRFLSSLLRSKKLATPCCAERMMDCR